MFQKTLLCVYACAAAAVVFVVSKLCYNVFFHPLRGFPGPLACRATRAYYLIWDVQGVSHWKVKEWHEKYGDVVRIAPDELSYTAKEAWPEIYGFPNKEGTGNFEKDAQWWNKTVSGVENILTANEESHRRMRRVQNSAFSDKALKAQESVISGYESLMLHKLHGEASNPDTAVVDMTNWYSFFTFDVIGDLSFGEPFYCLHDAQLHWWIKAVTDIFRAGTYLRAARRFPQPLSGMLLKLAPSQLIETRVKQFMFCAERVRKRLEQEAEDGRGMSVDEMFVAAQVLIVAGSETTATALTGATYLVLSNPSTFQSLCEEIRTRFQQEGEITIASTAGLPYLNAVLEESLRLCPPGPGTFPRTVPEGGKIVCGQFVPGGFTVGVHQLSINRSSRHFTEPETFAPERWLKDTRFTSDDKSATQPFSFGPRNCIGRNLAYAEMRTLLSRMVWNFDMELCPESVGWLDSQRMFTAWYKTEMKIKLVPRMRGA